MDQWLKSAIQSGREMRALGPAERGGADKEYVKDQYEDHWGKRIATLDKKIEDGESFEHIVMAMRPRSHLLTKYNRVAGRLAKEVLGDSPPTTNQGKPLIRLGVAARRYVAVSNFEPLSGIFLKAAGFRQIVELGAGPGWNLFEMCTMMGRKAQNKRFFGLEYTDAGVEIMSKLAEKGGLPLTAHHFDWTKPDFSMVPDNVPTLFFSHHSIEQVEDISPDVYAQLYRRRAPTTLIHCEPIGWQRFPELATARRLGDDDIFRALVAQRTDSLDDEDAPAVNAAINSWRTRYNRNCLPLIHMAEKRGLLSVDEIIYDFTSSNNSNPVNCSTYIEIKFLKKPKLPRRMEAAEAEALAEPSAEPHGTDPAEPVAKAAPALDPPASEPAKPQAGSRRRRPSKA